jgi:hypothetical protein
MLAILLAFHWPQEVPERYVDVVNSVHWIKEHVVPKDRE